jgi:thiamine-phosphate pyrophosphorylase
MTRPAPRPGPVYAIADAEALELPLPEGVARMAEAGIRWIQVRAKKLSGADFYRALERCCRALEGSGAALWVDDRADLAALFPVAGVHVGQTDLPPEAARRVVGPRLWVGLSTHGLEQLAVADRDPDVDVVALGPIFPTTGKENPDPVVGLETLREARRRTAKPLVAIGGIDASNAAAVLAAGADTVAVLGAVCRGDVTAGCRRLLESAGAA